MLSKIKNEETRLIEGKLMPRFTNVEAYRYNPASIRVRIIDECFKHKSNPERDNLVSPLLDELPQEIQDDITILLLLTEEEKEQRMMNVEFESPSPSML
jgi:predicted nucleotide-binding protein (sugar kinase/HSP70/actin superfamily)